MVGYLIVFKRTKMYRKPTMMTIAQAKIELATTNARLSGARGRNTKAWFLPEAKHNELLSLADTLTTESLRNYIEANAQVI